jgi:hypothetical protein
MAGEKSPALKPLNLRWLRPNLKVEYPFIALLADTHLHPVARGALLQRQAHRLYDGRDDDRRRHGWAPESRERTINAQSNTGSAQFTTTFCAFF